MKKLVFALIALSLGLYTSNSSAQIFQIKVTDYGDGAGNAAFESFVNAEIQKIENQINEDLPSAQPDRLMEGMANSAVLAGKGLGADYASGMKVFLIGAGAGVGADLAKDKNTDSELSGVGVAPGMVVGMNLGWMDSKYILGMDTDRLNLFLNFMTIGKKNLELNDKPGEESFADIDSTALGFRLRYDWIKGKGSKLLGWGGVKFHFGYEYSKTNITFRSNINKTVNETSSGGEVLSGTFTGSPEATIKTAVHSIPIELSTDVQLLYILSLYGGIGADYSFGEAKGDGTINGGSTPISCTGGACGPGTNVTVKPEANIDATGKVNPMMFRGFAGVQVNLPFMRIYVQGNKPFGSELVGVNAGVRFVY